MSTFSFCFLCSVIFYKWSWLLAVGTEVIIFLNVDWKGKEMAPYRVSIQVLRSYFESGGGGGGEGWLVTQREEGEGT